MKSRCRRSARQRQQTARQRQQSARQRQQTARYSGVFALLPEKGMLGMDNLDPEAWSAVVMRFVSSIVAK